ncbi:MAG: hypothetical protein ICV68_17575, partial [Pyrinomonadaceae bacterium]|nr:hypothetical protein [Pyrinomonadaceae bacterium]
VDAQGLCDLFVGAFVSLAAVGMQQDTGAGLHAGGRVAAADQVIKVLSLLMGKRQGSVFAHNGQFTPKTLFRQI